MWRSLLFDMNALQTMQNSDKDKIVTFSSYFFKVMPKPPPLQAEKRSTKYGLPKAFETRCANLNESPPLCCFMVQS